MRPGIFLSTILHGAIFGSAYVVFPMATTTMSEETIIVPVELVTIDDTTNLTAPQPDPVEEPEPEPTTRTLKKFLLKKNQFQRMMLKFLTNPIHLLKKKVKQNLSQKWPIQSQKKHQNQRRSLKKLQNQNQPLNQKLFHLRKKRKKKPILF